MSHHKQKLVRGAFLTYLCEIVHFFLPLLIVACHFIEKKHQHDPDEDFGMGPSTFSEAKSTIFREVSYYLIPCSGVCVITILHIFFSLICTRRKS